jgi:hypothetical protein
MYSREFTDKNNKTWSRIDKRQARNLYNKGVTLMIIADNLRPFTMWACEGYINKSDNVDNTDFNKRVMYFEVYNCINRETGYHAAFYKEVE